MIIRVGSKRLPNNVLRLSLSYGHDDVPKAFGDALILPDARIITRIVEASESTRHGADVEQAIAGSSVNALLSAVALQYRLPPDSTVERKKEGGKLLGPGCDRASAVSKV